MGGIGILGAIAFDPTIRGILVVLTGTVVLGGSIYLILLTNTGARVGFLLSATGLFGWMVLMGIIWVIYGIGLKGRDPAWMPTDINFSRETPVSGQLATLPPSDDLPDPEALLDERPLLHALVLGSEGADYQPSTLTKVKTVTQPFVTTSRANLMPIARDALVEAEAVLSEHPEVAELLEAGGFELRDEARRQSAELRDEIADTLDGWCLLTEADPRRGEAQASADAALTENKAFGDPTEPADYIVKDVFMFGGKIPCEPMDERSSLSQAWHRFASVFQVKNPEMHGAVTVVKAVDFPEVAGEAPPPATEEEGASTVTVGMLRNLGNKRFIPFMFTVFNLLGFVVFTMILHYRDKEAMAVRDAFGGGKGK